MTNHITVFDLRNMVKVKRRMGNQLTKNEGGGGGGERER